jgi:hypothetical protein
MGLLLIQLRPKRRRCWAFGRPISNNGTTLEYIAIIINCFSLKHMPFNLVVLSNINLLSIFGDFYPAHIVGVGLHENVVCQPMGIGYLVYHHEVWWTTPSAISLGVGMWGSSRWISWHLVSVHVSWCHCMYVPSDLSSSSLPMIVVLVRRSFRDLA